jgi:hypothetical protein
MSHSGSRSGPDRFPADLSEVNREFCEYIQLLYSRQRIHWILGYTHPTNPGNPMGFRRWRHDRMSESNLGTRIMAVAAAMLLFIALPSVALHSILGIHVKVWFEATVLILFLVRAGSIHYEKSEKLVLVLALLLALTVIAWLWSTLMSQLLMGITLVIMIALTWSTTRASFSQQSVSFLYRFTIIMLVGAWIGSLYSLSGGGPTYCFANPDGRQNCLYLTTFSNSDASLTWGLIRPGGIFDEPGALSYFVTLVVCLNELCNGGRRRSIILFVLGLVTLSVAHVFCFAAYAAFALRRRIAYVVLALAVVAGPMADELGEHFGEGSLLGEGFFRRFSISDGQLTGDNRSGQVSEFFSLVDYKMSRYGSNAMAKYDMGGIASVDQSSNPFSIWFGYGVVMWIPYAAVLVVLARNIFQRKRAVQITAVLLVLLLLQRPNVYSLYWGLSTWSVIALMFIRKASTDEDDPGMANRLQLTPQRSGT